jgi:hypothetical protein
MQLAQHLIYLPDLRYNSVYLSAFGRSHLKLKLSQSSGSTNQQKSRETSLLAEKLKDRIGSGCEIRRLCP